MFKNYVTIAWRNLKRNKLHSTINILGLAIAFSVCFILFLTAYFQLSYDSFHTDKSQLFRTTLFTNSSQGVAQNTQLPLPISPALVSEIPDIAAAVRVNMGLKENVSYLDKNIERVVTRTDPGFFEMFNFPVKTGSSTETLSGIQDIAISESMAKALFGETDAIGKEIGIGKIGSQQYFTVTAIVNDCPRNSSIQFDAVARIESLPDYNNNENNWGNNSSYVFLKIAAQSNQQMVESKLVPFVEKYYSDQLAQLKTEHPETMETRDLLSLNLTNMEEIHFSGERSTPLALVYAISGLGAFILLIACFNFVNLNLAQSFRRSRELGVRKTLGAFKGQLFLQLWGEAFLLYGIGFILGIVLFTQLLPIFNAQFDARLELSTLFEPGFIMTMMGVFIMVTLIAGGYPALKMANFKLVGILKGTISSKKPGILRNSLLVTQFAISTLLICVSWIAGQQLDFLRQKPIGFEREQVVSIPVGKLQDGRKVLDRLRNELANDPNVIAISGTATNLGRGRDRMTSRTTIGIDYDQNQISADWLLGDFDYLKTLEIPLLKGRDFDPKFANDTINAVVVTESFVKAMGVTDPIGKYFGGDDAASGHQIIGVVADFNAYSPADITLPVVIHLSSSEAINYIFLKVVAEDPQLVIDKLSSVWERVASNAVFEPSFLNENLQAWYEGESIMTKIFALASGIAIFLSCLGLFAISLMVIEARTKEIGIRKVLGASVNRVVYSISIYFLRLVLISLVIALPLAWFAMQTWIQNYVYRIDLNPITFLMVGIMVAIIALATVGYHTVKAAGANPVKSLRTE